jgi:hypothetical protein
MNTLVKSLCAILCCSLTMQVFAAGTNEMEVIDYGIYKISGESSVDEGKSPSGNVLTGGKAELIKQTDKIPAKLGAKFGFRFSIPDNFKKQKLKFVYLFPDIKNPQTDQILNRFEGAARYDGKSETAGIMYDFTEERELAPGEWTFQVFAGDRKVLEKKFTVVKVD